MKKLLRIVALFVLSIALVGCGAEGTSSYKLEEGGMKSVLTYTYKGDTVTKQTTENEMTYEALGMTGEDDARLLFDSYAAELEGVEGIEHSITYNEESFVETMSIDYETLDVEKAEGLPGIIVDGEGSKISMKESEKMLVEMGYEKV